MENTNKNKITAGLLGIFMGYLGIHNFYLGNKGKGIAQALLWTIGISIYITSIFAMSFLNMIVEYICIGYAYYFYSMMLMAAMSLGGIIYIGAYLWGFIEGLMILLKKEDNDESKQKSKIGATILAILLGAFGAHDFYLGYTKKAIAHILITILGALIIIGPLVSWIWAFIEGIKIISGEMKTDARGMEIRQD